MNKVDLARVQSLGEIILELAESQGYSTAELAVCCELLPEFLFDEYGTKVFRLPTVRQSNN